MTTLPRTGAVIAKVDWDNDGDFTDTYDDISSDLWHGDVLTINRGLDQARALGRPIVPLTTWRQRNQEGRYSTEYSGSPLHGLLKPGRPVIFEQELGDAVTMDDADVAMDDAEALMGGLEAIRLFTGFTDEPAEAPGRFFRRVAMRALGASGQIKGAYVTIGYQATITTGAAAVLVLTALGLDTSKIDSDVITNGRAMLHWYAYRREAWTLLEEIWATEGPPAAMYEDEYGLWNFEGRNYFTLQSRCQVAQHTFTDTSTTSSAEEPTMDSTTVTMDDPIIGIDGDVESDVFVALTYEPGYKYIVNDATIEVTQKVSSSTVTLWTYNGSLTLAASETVTIFAKVNDPVSSIVTPVSGTDFTASVALASISASVIGGTTIAIVLTATASGSVITGFGGATGIKVRGVQVTTSGSVNAEPTIDTSASQAEYGVRSLSETFPIWRTLDPAVASGLCDAYVLHYQDPRPVVRVKIQNRTGKLLRQILTRKISDRIHILDVNGLSGIDLDVQIKTLTYTMQGEWLQSLEMGCEKVVEQDWALWDVTEWDDPDTFYGQ